MNPEQTVKPELDTSMIKVFGNYDNNEVNLSDRVLFDENKSNTLSNKIFDLFLDDTIEKFGFDKNNVSK